MKFTYTHNLLNYSMSLICILCWDRHLTKGLHIPTGNSPKIIPTWTKYTDLPTYTLMNNRTTLNTHVNLHMNASYNVNKRWLNKPDKLTNLTIISLLTLKMTAAEAIKTSLTKCTVLQDYDNQDGQLPTPINPNPLLTISKPLPCRSMLILMRPYGLISCLPISLDNKGSTVYHVIACNVAPCFPSF